MTKRRSFALFVICYLAYTSIYIARLNFSMATSAFKDMHYLTAGQIGILGSVFSVFFAFGRLINGALGDKKEPYFMISVGLLGAGVANLIIGFLPPFPAFLVLWGANAFAQSMLWSSVLCFLAAICPPDKLKKKTSIMVSSVATGNILGIVVGSLTIKYFGLKAAFFVPGALTLALSGIVLFTFKSVKAIPEASEKKHKNLFEIMKNREMQIAIFPIFAHGIIKDNISLWMALFFVEKYNIDLQKSSLFIIFIPVAGFVGRTVYPMLLRLFGENEHLVSVFAFGLCILFCVPLIASTTTPFVAAGALGLIYAMVSIINTSFLSIFPLKFADSGNISSISGLADLIVYSGAAFGSLIFGSMIESYGYGSMFAVWAGVCAVALVFMFYMLRYNKKGISEGE